MRQASRRARLPGWRLEHALAAWQQGQRWWWTVISARSRRRALCRTVGSSARRPVARYGPVGKSSGGLRRGARGRIGGESDGGARGLRCRARAGQPNAYRKRRDRILSRMGPDLSFGSQIRMIQASCVLPGEPWEADRLARLAEKPTATDAGYQKSAWYVHVRAPRVPARSGHADAIRDGKVAMKRDSTGWNRDAERAGTGAGASPPGQSRAGGPVVEAVRAWFDEEEKKMAGRTIPPGIVWTDWLWLNRCAKRRSRQRRAALCSAAPSAATGRKPRG